MIVTQHECHAQIAEETGKIFQSEFKPVEQYQRATSIKERGLLLKYDKLVLEFWGAFLKGQTAAYNADRQRIVDRNSAYNEEIGRYKADKEEYDTDAEALTVRRRVVETFEKSDSADNFKAIVKEYPRIGIVNDKGYFYRFYDAENVRVGDAASTEQADIRRESERLAKKSVELKKWSSSLADYAKETNRIQVSLKLFERDADLTAAKKPYNEKYKSMQSAIASYNKTVRERKAQKEAAAAENSNSDVIDKVRRHLQKILNDANAPGR